MFFIIYIGGNSIIVYMGNCFIWVLERFGAEN